MKHYISAANPMHAQFEALASYPATHFSYAFQNGVATLTLNRPERKNPLTFASYAELRDLFRAFNQASDVKAVVLTGDGGNFCSGGDVHEIIGPLTKMSMPELLEFTRGTASNLQLQPLNYHSLIHDVLHEIEAESRGRNVEVRCGNEPPHITILVDATRLMRVFFNLIHNATEMMPQGGSVTLRFVTDEAGVTTEIEDTGPGIAPEIAMRLFEPFATHGKAHGTGLGLSICKRIIEDHQGSIFARSEPGRGAVFGFTLPRAAGDHATETMR